MNYNLYQTFVIKTAAVVMEALPFILLGSLVSAAIHVYMTEDFVRKRIPDSTLLQILSGISLSMFLPTCECGIVPVVRGLAGKGVPAPMAAAYMIAAPVINPLTLLSTYVGFRGSVQMTLGRVVINLVIAFIVGYLFSIMKKPFKDTPSACGHSCYCGHSHHHAHESRLKALLTHGRDDFFSTLSYLIAGAVFASAFQTFMPTGLLSHLADSHLMSLAAMMGFAVVLSVCAEADSFVAASFVKFSPASQLAFVSIGSVIDLKLLMMYQSLFSKRVILVLAIAAAVIVFALSALSPIFLRGVFI